MAKYIIKKKQERRKKNREKRSRYQFLSFETALFRFAPFPSKEAGEGIGADGIVEYGRKKKESKLNSRDKWRGVDLPGKLSRDPWRGSDPETRLLAKARGTVRCNGEDASLEVDPVDERSTNAIIKH